MLAVGVKSPPPPPQAARNAEASDRAIVVLSFMLGCDIQREVDDGFFCKAPLAAIVKPGACG
jgi:hypothetical protein